MNYLQDIKCWADENWREFGLEFLQQAGWDRDWISDFDVFSVKGKRFLVSLRHNINEGPVGTEIEKNIISRMRRANADGFIGFYSGEFTTSLQARLKTLSSHVDLIGGVQVSVLLPYFSSNFIDKFFGAREDGWRWGWNCYLNKENKAEYKPLFCMCGCGKDILEGPLAIGLSAAFVHLSKDRLYFIYGLKGCIFKVCEDNTSCGWVEVNQILHPDQFNIWNGQLKDYLSENPHIDLSEYHSHKRLFVSRILQRMRSINAGFFLAAEEF
ncbi:hypothetical protein P5Z57_28075 [Pseudomonas sp. CD3(2023)]|uniref:hypothetical protein n=1 Tax=Pseudomonas sp. CD3(2023) TaxID=3036552 RepID=UPI0031BA765B